MTGTAFPDVPDFARLYDDPDWPLTPSMARYLWESALMLADTHRDRDTWNLLREELPPIARSLVDDVWMRRFVSCFDALAARLATSQFEPGELASSTGEEMALHLVIDSAEAGVNDGTIPVDLSLPEHAAGDHDFEWARDVLFEDHDVLLLFDASLDGIEETDSELNQQFHFANLHPQRWFLPFPGQTGPGP